MIFKIKYFFFQFLLKFFTFFKVIKEKKHNSCLLYHSIPNIADSNNLDEIELSKFEKQCLYILRHKYFKFTNTKENLNVDNNNITITFDDGYKNIISNVLPIIKKYKIPILIFLCPSLIGRINYLNKNDLRTLLETNLVEFGIHGYEHIYYGEESIDLFKNHLDQSFQWFYKNLNQYKPISLSFPYGSFNKEIIKFLKIQKKIKFCFNSNFSTYNFLKIDNYSIPRISIWQLDNIQCFEDKIKGKWDILKYFIKTNEK